MDLDDIWQENKRWILGCVAGLLVFLIAKSILGGDHAGGMAKVNKLGAAVRGKEFYKNAQLTNAQKDRADLVATLDRLRAAMHHDVPKRFEIQGDPDLFWARTYNEVRQELFDIGYNANVDFPETSLSWQSATDREQLQRQLVGLSLVEHTVRHLIAAHRAVTAKDVEALGLRSIGAFTPDRARKKKMIRRRDGDPIQPAELLEEVRIGFKFESDNATLHRFMENCRDDKSTRVTLGSLTIKMGRRSGDPLSVSGEMISLQVKPLP